MKQRGNRKVRTIALVLLMFIAMTSIHASKAGELSLNAGYGSYILTKDPMTLHSIETNITNTDYYNGTPFGLTLSFSGKVPLFYTHNGISSGTKAFKSRIDIEAAIMASAKINTRHADTVFSLGSSTDFRFIMFQNMGIQAILMFGPRADISTNLHITDTVSFRIGISGTWQAFKKDYMHPDAPFYQGNSFAITPTLGITIHSKSDNWEFGRL